MLGIIWKLGYLSFYYCHDCFAGTCKGRLNWVQCQEINVAKLDHNFNRWYQFVYEVIFIMLGVIKKSLLIFLSIGTLFVMIAWQKGAQSDYSRRIVKKKLSKIAPLFEIQHDVLFRRISVQWMGSGYVYALTKEKRRTWHTMHFPYNPIYFATFIFFIAPNLLTLHTPQWNNPNK